MAQRRMFSSKIVESDAFLDMPISSQALYFHLGMEADDDGFVNPKRVMRAIGAPDDDLKVLLGKRFILPFENGVIVIKHWLINNMIRKDFYKETVYLDEKKRLIIKDNKAYTDNVDKMLTKPTHSIGKDSIGKDRLTKVRIEGNTPSQIATDFFSKGKTFSELLDLFSKTTSSELLLSEFDKFILYWTEPNGSGTKQRWQQQPVFDVKRRLVTWLGKINTFTSRKETKII